MNSLPDDLNRAVDFQLEHLFSFPKYIWMHAVPHGASGSKKGKSIEGPGYVCALGAHTDEFCTHVSLEKTFYCWYMITVNRISF